MIWRVALRLVSGKWQNSGRRIHPPCYAVKREKHALELNCQKDAKAQGQPVLSRRKTPGGFLKSRWRVARNYGIVSRVSNSSPTLIPLRQFDLVKRTRS